MSQHQNPLTQGGSLPLSSVGQNLGGNTNSVVLSSKYQNKGASGAPVVIQNKRNQSDSSKHIYSNNTHQQANNGGAGTSQSSKTIDAALVNRTKSPGNTRLGMGAGGQNQLPSTQIQSQSMNQQQYLQSQRNLRFKDRTIGGSSGNVVIPNQNSSQLPNPAQGNTIHTSNNSLGSSMLVGSQQQNQGSHNLHHQSNIIHPFSSAQTQQQTQQMQFTAKSHMKANGSMLPSTTNHPHHQLRGISPNATKNQSLVGTQGASKKNATQNIQGETRASSNPAIMHNKNNSSGQPSNHTNMFQLSNNGLNIANKVNNLFKNQDPLQDQAHQSAVNNLSNKNLNERLNTDSSGNNTRNLGTLHIKNKTQHITVLNSTNVQSIGGTSASGQGNSSNQQNNMGAGGIKQIPRKKKNQSVGHGHHNLNATAGNQIISQSVLNNQNNQIVPGNKQGSQYVSSFFNQQQNTNTNPQYENSLQNQQQPRQSPLKYPEYQQPQQQQLTTTQKINNYQNYKINQHYQNTAGGSQQAGSSNQNNLGQQKKGISQNNISAGKAAGYHQSSSQGRAAGGGGQGAEMHSNGSNGANTRQYSTTLLSQQQQQQQEGSSYTNLQQLQSQDLPGTKNPSSSLVPPLIKKIINRPKSNIENSANNQPTTTSTQPLNLQQVQSQNTSNPAKKSIYGTHTNNSYQQNETQSNLPTVPSITQQQQDQNLNTQTGHNDSQKLISVSQLLKNQQQQQPPSSLNNKPSINNIPPSQTSTTQQPTTQQQQSASIKQSIIKRSRNQSSGDPTPISQNPQHNHMGQGGQAGQSIKSYNQYNSSQLIQQQNSIAQKSLQQQSFPEISQGTTNTSSNAQQNIIKPETGYSQDNPSSGLIKDSQQNNTSNTDKQQDNTDSFTSNISKSNSDSNTSKGEDKGKDGQKSDRKDKDKDEKLEHQTSGIEYYNGIRGEVRAVFESKVPILPDYQKAKHSSKRNGIVAGYGANTNQGIVRNYNEDRVAIILNIMKPKNKGNSTDAWPKCSFFGIYDGHGGSTCADFLRDYLHQFIIKDENFPQNPIKALRNGFREAERLFLEFAESQHKDIGELDKSGSCAIILLIIDDMCYIANTGDSRAVMSADGGEKIFVLSNDHKPTDQVEINRIVSNNGRIYQNQSFVNVINPVTGQPQQQVVYGPHRVFPGRLSVSRTFGDIEAKMTKYEGNPKVIVAEPDIMAFQIKNNHDFVVLGCDGIFDKIDNKDSIHIIWQGLLEKFQQDKQNKKPSTTSSNLNEDKDKKDLPVEHSLCGHAVDILLQTSALRKTCDNITLVVVAFDNFVNIYNNYINNNLLGSQADSLEEIQLEPIPEIPDSQATNKAKNSQSKDDDIIVGDTGSNNINAKQPEKLSEIAEEDVLSTVSENVITQQQNAKMKENQQQQMQDKNKDKNVFLMKQNKPGSFTLSKNQPQNTGMNIGSQNQNLQQTTKLQQKNYNNLLNTEKLSTTQQQPTSITGGTTGGQLTQDNNPSQHQFKQQFNSFRNKQYQRQQQQQQQDTTQSQPAIIQPQQDSQQLQQVQQQQGRRPMIYLNSSNSLNTTNTNATNGKGINHHQSSKSTNPQERGGAAGGAVMQNNYNSEHNQFTIGSHTVNPGDLKRLNQQSQQNQQNQGTTNILGANMSGQQQPQNVIIKPLMSNKKRRKSLGNYQAIQQQNNQSTSNSNIPQNQVTSTQQQQQQQNIQNTPYQNLSSTQQNPLSQNNTLGGGSTGGNSASAIQGSQQQNPNAFVKSRNAAGKSLQKWNSHKQNNQ